MTQETLRSNKFEKTPEECRPYKLVHQLISYVGINLQRRTLIGLSEMTFIAKKSNLRCVKINAKGCTIYRVLLNDTIDLNYDYYDMTLEMTKKDTPNNQFSIEQLSSDHRDSVLDTDPDAGGGELIVRLPPESSHIFAEGRPFRIKLEFTIENPSSGIHFFVPSTESLSLEKAHMFTTRYENSSRLCFPCIDSFSEVCTWKLEFTVDESLTVVSVGDLIEVVQIAGARKKTYHYYLTTPTAAPNIGFAIGPFDIYVDPHMHEVTYFCLPGLMSLLRWTTRFLHEIFEYYEESLSARFPYSCFKYVFVNESFEEMTTYASMCILDINLLHTSAIIDQTYVTRRFQAISIAEQFYSCFISKQHSSDSWLSLGISRYLSGLYLKKFFGNNEYRHWVHSELQEVIKYEQQYGGVILDPSHINQNSQAANSANSSSYGGGGGERRQNQNQPPSSGEGGFYFSLQNPQTVSPLYLKIQAKKSHLVLRMLEHRIGSQLLLQVLNKQLSLASIYIAQSQQTGMGLMPANVNTTPNQNGTSGQTAPGSNPTNPMLISTTSFTRAIFTVTGKDMTVFMDQWVRQGGHVRFHMSFIFNRKRNTVELELKQECIQQLGVRKYVGPLTVALQELDGTFRHVLQIEGTHAKADIVCHSKSRRQKKKKIPLCTGEEVDMDLSTMDADSPVLWIRLDPDMTLVRAVDTRQPDFQWQYQLRHERDITAQIEAIWALENYPTPQTRMALTDLIENEQAFFKVRCEACTCLAKVANSMISTWTGPPAMSNIFGKLFGSFSCPTLVKQNDFSNLQHYFLQKIIPIAMATLRNVHGVCPPEVLKFLIDLFKHNDNSKNRFSDNYYRAALIKALGNTVTVTAISGTDITPDSMSQDTKIILEEICRLLNLEKLLQSYKFTVTVECLRALRKLQKFNHIPNNIIEHFKTYAVYGQFYDVRLAALEAIVDYTRTDGDLKEVEYLLEIIENDPVPSLRHDLIRIIIQNHTENSGERRKKSPFHDKSVALRLWNKINYESSEDARIRCVLIDLYYTFFGTKKPICLLDEEQQYHDSTRVDESSSRRKSPLTTREGVDDFKKDNVSMEEDEPPKMISAKVLSSKRESMASDNSEPELPDIMPVEQMETSMPMPTSFEPGMFKKDEDDELILENIREEEVEIEMESVTTSVPMSVDQSSTTSSHRRHHHHHHNKGKKKKEKKKKHKHKHKHKHSHDHKKKIRDETLSSATSASNSPSVHL